MHWIWRRADRYFPSAESHRPSDPAHATARCGGAPAELQFRDPPSQSNPYHPHSQPSYELKQTLAIPQAKLLFQMLSHACSAAQAQANACTVQRLARPLLGTGCPWINSTQVPKSFEMPLEQPCSRVEQLLGNKAFQVRQTTPCVGRWCQKLQCSLPDTKLWARWAIRCLAH